MSIDRELLWKAWPEGYLAMRGVHTVGDWLCMSSGDDDPSWVDVTNRHGFGSPFTYTFDEKTLKRGDLLPNVDPSDVATWGCLLTDLWKARGNILVPPANLYWRHEGSKDRWVLGQIRAREPRNQSPLDSAFGGHVSFNVDPNGTDSFTQDPALALVLARIQLRETP